MMLKNFVFTALLLVMIATYLSYKEMKKNRTSLAFSFTSIGIVFSLFIIGFTIDLFFNTTPLLLHSPGILWLLLAFSLLLEIFSLIKKIIPGQLLAASLLLFLVLPTIFSIGIFLLVIAIIELLIAFIIFQKTKDLGLN